MSLTFIIVLVIVGLLFFILEVLVIPGTSVAGVLGFVAIAVAVWQAWIQYGYETGLLVLAGSLVGSILCLWLSL
nr:nodulation efficiency protein D (NfeD) [Bacteroidales bacterium]